MKTYILKRVDITKLPLIFFHNYVIGLDDKKDIVFKFDHSFGNIIYIIIYFMFSMIIMG